MNTIKKVPLPLSGVMLSLAALGNLLQSYSDLLRTICGLLATFLLVLLLLKLFCFPAMVWEDLQNPITAGVSATFPMTLMLLSTYLKPLIGGSAILVWYLAIGLHVLLIAYFTTKFLLHFDIKKVFSVYFIVYVGIVVASVSAPAYGKEALGGPLFWFGFVCLLALLALVSYRYIKYPVPDPAKPLLCIYAAPTSLCLAGYIQSVSPKSPTLILGLLFLANAIYLFALVKSFGYLRGPFYPSWAAFTFPFVITAIASKQAMACLAKLDRPLPILAPIVLLETLLAVIFVFAVFFRFMALIFQKEE